MTGTEQVNHFKYLGCLRLSVLSGALCTTSVNELCESIRRNLDYDDNKEARLKFYKLMALPFLMYRSEVWVNEQKRRVSNKRKKKLRVAPFVFLTEIRAYVGQTTLLDYNRTEHVASIPPRNFRG